MSSAHLQEQHRIVRDDPVQSPPNAPLHLVLRVHRPRQHLAMVLLPRILQEALPSRSHQDRQQHVEPDMRHLEKVPRIRHREPDMHDGERGHILLRQREKLGRPDPHDDPVRPAPPVRQQRRRLRDRLADEAHDRLRVVVELDVQQQPDLLQARLRQVLQDVPEPGHGLMGFRERAQRLELRPRLGDDLVRLPEAALQRRVVAQHDHVVFREVHVGLQGVRARGDRALERQERVLGILSTEPAVGDALREPALLRVDAGGGEGRDGEGDILIASHTGGPEVGRSGHGGSGREVVLFAHGGGPATTMPRRESLSTESCEEGCCGWGSSQRKQESCRQIDNKR
nr:hypothetical protein CFP56_56965 [Quercus suber]